MTRNVTLRVARHLGVSFLPGANLTHLWIGGARADALRNRWQTFVVERGLGTPLVIRKLPHDELHGYASLFPFMPEGLLRRIVASGQSPAETDAALPDELDALEQDAYHYRRSFGLYEAIAQHRGWVTMPALLGGLPALFLGIGRHCRLRIMNVNESVGAPLPLAGLNKAFGRDLLGAFGIPVPPGLSASTPEMAANAAGRLGFPVALKKIQAGNSAGVILGIGSARACQEAAAFLLQSDPAVLVEAMLSGPEFRLHFLDGRLAHVFAGRSRTIVGDGRSSLHELLRRDHPEYYLAMRSTTYQRRRLVLQLWSSGVRTQTDLERVVPPRDATVRVSAAVGEGMGLVDHDVIHADDRRALEALLRRFGAPSAAFDLIVPEEGVRLAEGGGVLDVNVPCGFHYLPNAPQAADRELLALAAREPSLLDNGGRVEVWIASESEFSPPHGEAIRRRFLSAWPGGRVASVSPASGWLPVLSDHTADAFLIWLTEATIEAHGMPHHLRPAVLYLDSESAFERRYPLLVAAARHAGATFMMWQASNPPGHRPAALPHPS